MQLLLAKDHEQICERGACASWRGSTSHQGGLAHR
jgi:hypothetical protein